MLMSTNKEVVVVHATESLCTFLRNLGYSDLAEKALIAPAFYLVDSPFAQADLNQPIYPHERRKELLAAWFNRVFEQQLAELGLPDAVWPETTSEEVFLNYFSVEYHPLIGDVGALQLKTREVPL